MDLSNQLSCETGNFSCHRNPHRFLQPEVLSLYFPIWEPWVVWSVSLPSCSSLFIHTQMWDLLERRAPHAYESSLSQLPVSTPPTGQDECLFCNSLIVDFHKIQFSGSYGYFLFLNLLLSFFWLCKKSKCI